MLTLPTAFETAVTATGHEPIWLVELGGVGRFYASHDKDFGRTWRLGEGLYIGGGWRIGERRAAYEGIIAEGGMGRIARALDDTGQSARVGSLTIDLLGHANIGADLGLLPLDNTPVRVLMGFRDLAYPEYVALYLGVVDNTEETWTSYLLDVIDDTLRAHRNLSVPIGSLYFPGAPASNRGKSIPILVGRNTDVEALQIIGAAAGTLALTLQTSGTELFMGELGAPFPATGTVTVGTETGVTYTARSFVTINGISYLRLSGLTRGAPALQNAGDAVTLTGYTNTYLVGYETGDITAVRDAGVIVDTADYTVTTAEADRTVTVIEFDAAPTGVVTIDADGLNVTPVTGITNGGFETGAESPWVETGAANLTVSTGSTANGNSVYKGVLVGSEDADETIYIDFDTTPGTYYTLEFDYKDNTVSNLITNPDFGSGLTGWTISTSSVNGTAVPQLGDYGFATCALKAVNDYALRDTTNTFQTLLYQDVTTSIGAQYTLSFKYLGYRWYLRPSGQAGAVYVQMTTHSLGGYRIGITSDDDSIASQAASSATAWPRVTLTDGHEYREVSVTFTATATTTRVTFEGYGQAFNYPLFPVIIRDILLVQNTNLPTSTTTYALGTSSDDNAYAEEILAHRYSWTRINAAFQALSTSTRLSFRSQWFDQSCATHLDSAQIRDGGRNPADAIRYVIEELLSPDFTVDESSFQTAFGKLSAWQFGGVMTDPGDSRQRLDDMAWQCNSRLVVSNEGKLQLLVRDGDPPQALLRLDSDNIVDDSVRQRREPIDNVYTDFRVWYGRASGERDDQQGFQTSVNASPDSTTHPNQPLNAQCASAQAIYGSRHVLERRADMIRDLTTAHLLLAALVERHTVRQTDIDLRCFHSVGVQLTLGDYVEAFHPRINLGRLTLCEVLAVDIGAQDVGLKLRTVRDLGFYEPWDFPLLLVEGDRLFEPWSS